MDAGVELVDVFVEPVIDLWADLGISVDAPIWTVGDGVLAKVGSVVTPQGVMATARIPEPAYCWPTATSLLSWPGWPIPVTPAPSCAAQWPPVPKPWCSALARWIPGIPRPCGHQPAPCFKSPLAVESSVGERIGAHPHQGEPCDEADLTGPLTLVVGNEAHGLDQTAAVDRWVSIPMAESVESLNVASAAAVICFEVARQRRS